jgi:hypothetical protein
VGLEPDAYAGGARRGRVPLGKQTAIEAAYLRGVTDGVAEGIEQGIRLGRAYQHLEDAKKALAA